MGRNYFSKHGGPYFINDGFSRHSDIKPSQPDKGLLSILLIGLSIVVAIICSFLYSL